MERLFLDANVLFSASYRESAGLLRLWDLPEAVLMTSGYAAEEARRNLETDAARARLERLLSRTTLVAEAPDVQLPASVRLPAKDRPILQAAIAASASWLVTGDLRDFGALMGKQVLGVRVETPGRTLATLGRPPRKR
jgi:predicted nucleic acid-binding protein